MLVGSDDDVVRRLLLLLVVGLTWFTVAAKEEGNSKLLTVIQKAHPLWLRERCLEDFYAHLDTRQPKYNIHEEKSNLTVASVIQEENAFIVTFSDQKRCSFGAGILEDELANKQTFLQVDEWGIPPLYIWDKSLIAPPTFHHDDLVSGDSFETKQFLSTLISTGIALVSDVPRQEGECARFGAHFSSLRETEWGRNFNVRSTPDAAFATVKKDLAYTSHAIGMHIDSPYRIDTPPAYQLLHAIDHCTGPDCYVHNQFVDGFAVADTLCRERRVLFDKLTQVVLRWENNGGDDNSLLFRYAPMIQLDDKNHQSMSTSCPSVTAINFSAKSGGYAPNLPRGELETFYQAKRLFSSLLHDPEYTIKLQLFEGALVIFDNRRVLHSRSEIAVTDGARWLQGCYLNREGIYYNYEVLRRKFAALTETPFRTLNAATKADFDRMGVEYDESIVQQTMTNLVGLLQAQSTSYLGQPVSLYDHNLQTATRALRAEEDDETIAVSLFHDVFETLAVKNHGELVAAMLAPWISPKSQWLLAHHEIFQGFYYFEHYHVDKNKREMFEASPYYNATVRWCELYDQASFDPDYPPLPLAALLPAVERVLARPQYWWNPGHPKAGAVSLKEDKDSSLDAATIVVEQSRDVCEDTWNCYHISSWS